MPTHVDLLICADWVLPIAPQNQALEQHCVAISQGRIVAIEPQSQADQFVADETVRLPGQVLMPGFVNAHTHAAMTLLRGIADDLPLMDWLSNHIWPAEAKWVDNQFVRDGARLAMAEMLLGGTTCFNDMYFFPDAVAWEAKAMGIRAAIGLIVIDFPTVWAQNADEYLSKGLSVHDEFRDNPLIHSVFAPHAPYTVSDGPLERIRTYADELELPVHMHVHETAFEVSDAFEKTGERPLRRLDRLGLLSPNLLAVHMTELNDSDIELVARSGASVVHCPESNMKLASGSCPVETLMSNGINIALGTDGAASNNDLDMLGELRSAALLAKQVSHDASALNAADALKMATLNGAQALGLGEEIGSIEIGKSADLIAIDLNHIQTQPVYDPISQIVYAAGREQVSNVWVAGRPRVADGQLVDIDQGQIIENAQAWGQRIAEQGAQD